MIGARSPPSASACEQQVAALVGAAPPKDRGEARATLATKVMPIAPPPRPAEPDQDVRGCARGQLAGPGRRGSLQPSQSRICSSPCVTAMAAWSGFVSGGEGVGAAGWATRRAWVRGSPARTGQVGPRWRGAQASDPPCLDRLGGGGWPACPTPSGKAAAAWRDRWSGPTTTHRSVPGRRPMRHAQPAELPGRQLRRS